VPPWSCCLDCADPHQEAGGVLVVDTTVSAFGRNPRGLRTLSQTTGVPIVMGSCTSHCPKDALALAPPVPAVLPVLMRGTGQVRARDCGITLGFCRRGERREPCGGDRARSRGRRGGVRRVRRDTRRSDRSLPAVRPLQPPTPLIPAARAQGQSAYRRSRASKSCGCLRRRRGRRQRPVLR